VAHNNPTPSGNAMSEELSIFLKEVSLFAATSISGFGVEMKNLSFDLILPHTNFSTPYTSVLDNFTPNIWASLWDLLTFILLVIPPCPPQCASFGRGHPELKRCHPELVSGSGMFHRQI
jgi:hypothetical protein